MDRSWSLGCINSGHFIFSLLARCFPSKQNVQLSGKVLLPRSATGLSALFSIEVRFLNSITSLHFPDS